MVHILSTLSKEIPDIIVVGIAYSIKGFEDWAAIRGRDFKPTHHPEKDKAWQDHLRTGSGRNDIIVEAGDEVQMLKIVVAH